MPDAYQLAVNSCRSGKLGCRIKIDESSVYVASPWEWVRWALKKRLRTVPVELRAFYEGNPEGGWLIAAKSANLAYWRTRQLWSVTEAAFLLGGYEPAPVEPSDAENDFGSPTASTNFSLIVLSTDGRLSKMGRA